MATEGQLPAGQPNLGSDPNFRWTRRDWGQTPRDRYRRIAVLISGRGAICRRSSTRSRRRAAQRRDRGGHLEPAGRRTGSSGRARPGSRRVDDRSPRVPTRELFEEALVRELRARDVSLVCLAGFMRLLGPHVSRRVSQRHPQHPPVAAARLSGRGRAAAGVEPRRQGRRRHGPPRDRRAGRRTDRPCSPPCRARRRHAGDARGADPRRRSTASIPKPSPAVLDGGWTIDGRRFVRRASTGSPRSAETLRSAARERLQRQHRHFGRAVDADRHVDRAHAAAHEDRRALAAARRRR